MIRIKAFLLIMLIPLYLNAQETHYSDTCQTAITFKAGESNRLIHTLTDPFGKIIARENEGEELNESNFVPFQGNFDKGRFFYGQGMVLMGHIWECSEYSTEGVCLGLCRSPQGMDYQQLYMSQVDKNCVELAGPVPEGEFEISYRDKVRSKCTVVVKRPVNVLEKIKQVRLEYSKSH
ncbi:hypothetical protein [Vibrio sp. HN007]|uniref:hypothetical protein n=1 Tax=Vibrio iocasae TaxID=3098914 RepID=UPI0035D4FB68